MKEFTEQQQKIIELEAWILNQADNLTKASTSLLLAVEQKQDTIAEQDTVDTLITSLIQSLRTMQTLTDRLTGKSLTFTVNTHSGQPVEVEVSERPTYQRVLLIGGKEASLTTRSYSVRLETEDDVYILSPEEYIKIGASRQWGANKTQWAAHYGLNIAQLEEITNIATRYEG